MNDSSITVCTKCTGKCIIINNHHTMTHYRYTSQLSPKQTISVTAINLLSHGNCNCRVPPSFDSYGSLGPSVPKSGFPYAFQGPFTYFLKFWNFFLLCQKTVSFSSFLCRHVAQLCVDGNSGLTGLSYKTDCHAFWHGSARGKRREYKE